MSERAGAVAAWFETAVGTWVGQRIANQDRVYSDGSTVALFDGIGGRAFGDVAASVALAEVVRRTAVDRLTAAECDIASVLRGADEAVRDAGASVGVHMGTTAVVGILEITDGDAVAHLGWAGDSAAFLLRGEGIRSLTASKAAPAHGQRPGLATWLGNGEHLPPRQASLALLPGDTLILVSDGITDVLTRSAIGWLVGSAGSPRRAVDQVLDAAQAAGAKDNCSIVVATIRTSPNAISGPSGPASLVRSAPAFADRPVEQAVDYHNQDHVRTVEDHARF